MNKTYRVELNYSYSGVYFDFFNFRDMVEFLGMAIENGHKDGEKLRATVSVINEEVGLDE